MDNSSFSTYVDHISSDHNNKDREKIIALYNHIKYRSTRVSDGSPESLRTTFINTERGIVGI